MNEGTAIYMRVSTGGQRLDSQDVELRRYCQRRGWKNLLTYSDKISGASAGRPGLDKLKADVRSGKVERVVVYALDRLGRSLSNLCLVLDDFKKHGVGVVVASQSIDTSTNDAAANLQLNVLSAVCQFEREMIVAARSIQSPELVGAGLLSLVAVCAGCCDFLNMSQAFGKHSATI